MNKKFRQAAAFVTAAAMMTCTIPISALAESNDNEIGRLEIYSTDNGMGYQIEQAENSIKTKSAKAAKVGSSESGDDEDLSLPTKYSLADEGLTTSVKNQMGTSSCWAFSAISCIEQNLVIKGVENNTVDFSEAALTWFGINTAIGGEDGTISKSPFEEGGNWMMAALTLSRLSGLEYEDFEPFLGDDPNDMDISDKQRNVCEYRLKNATGYSGEQEEIKEAVMQLGGVTVSYADDDKYFSNDEKSYYNPSANSVNHAVTIVGWDDNYSKYNFNSENRPETNGAWLVKGSWGNFNTDGYYYISYEEQELKYFCSFDMEEMDESDNVYTHTDSYGMVLAYAANSMSGANIFTAKSDEILRDVSFMVMNTEGENVKYTIDVYKNLTENSPIGKEKIAQESGTVSNDGYYSVDISAEPEISAGEKYSVVITFEYAGKYSYILCEGEENSSSEPGESYISSGKTWYDCNDSGYNNIYINAYTTNKSKPSKSKLSSLINATADISAAAKERNYAKKVYIDDDATAAQVENAYLLLESAIENSSKVKAISNEDEWNKFAKEVSSGNSMTGKIILLENDLDFSDKTFVPAATESKEFDGCFDGNGYIISGVNYSNSGGISSLFSSISENGQIKNLVVKDSTFSGEIAGGIVGNFNGQLIKNCGFTGTVKGTNYSGGLAGVISSGTVESCYASSTSQSSENTGNFFGNSDSGKKILASNLITADNFTETAYLLNTVSGSQSDSGLWTADASSAILTQFSKEPAHKITFDFLGNEFIRYSDYQGKTNYPKASIQDGYTVRWFIEDEEINSDYKFTKNTNVTAKLVKENSHVVKYVLNGGENSSNNPEFIANNETVTLSKPTKTGYTFVGWYDNENFYGEPISQLSDVSNDITLYANWLANKYSVTFLDNNGDTLSTQTVNYGDSAQPPDAPAVEGMVFTGWDGDYTCITKNVVISPIYSIYRNISLCNVTGVENFVYDGTKKELKNLTLKYGNYSLVLDKDYKITYSNNTNAGTAKAILEGIGNYHGTKTISFKINAKSSSSLNIASISAKTYTGSALKPSPVITDSNVTLKNNTDYTLSYRSNTNVGTAKITINFKGNYYGTRTTTFKINARDASTLSIASISSKTYTGSAIKPLPVITYSGNTLKNNTDYTLSYSSNINVGTAKITIKFKGNYTGTRVVSFKIIARSSATLTVGTISSKYYTGSAIKPGLTITYGKITLKKGTDYTLTYKNNIKIGTASIIIKFKGNYSGSKTIKFKIVKCPASKLKFSSISNKTYTGNQIKPSITIKNGNLTLKKGTDYTVSYKNNTKVGLASVIIKFKGNYSGSKTLNFKIIPKKVTVTNIKKPISGKFTVSWRTVKCSGYRIYYSTSSKFTTYKNAWAKGSSAKSKTVSGLTKGKTYYVKVRAYVEINGKKYYGAYSTVKKIKV